ncbi:MAG: peroxiredoxin [Chlamydiales bacterium]|nr:peroxiredoxin [Chlamydiales bacterium]
MEHAKDFTLKDHEGKNVRLSDFKGKWVILYFYPKDDTPGCTTEACDFTTLRTKHSDIVIIGVSPDSSESHAKFIAKHNLHLILLADPDKEVHRLYGTWGTKKNYGKEYEGVIRSTFLINPEGEIAKEWRNVKATGHAERVFKSLAESNPTHL